MDQSAVDPVLGHEALELDDTELTAPDALLPVGGDGADPVDSSTLPDPLGLPDETDPIERFDPLTRAGADLDDQADPFDGAPEKADFGIPAVDGPIAPPAPVDPAPAPVGDADHMDQPDAGSTIASTDAYTDTGDTSSDYI